MKGVTALVLSGKAPVLHDRFLVIEDEVLFLGNSLNALGERDSLIFGVPDDAWSARVEGGYRFVAPRSGIVGLTPYAAAQFTTFDLPAYAG